jgi:putative endonuclease
MSIAKQDALRSLGKGGRLEMHYAYLLQSETVEDQRCVGVTSDSKQRLAEHNAGKSSHTSKYAPWRLATYIALPDQREAEIFERYLKSGSGQAFARRRL